MSRTLTEQEILERIKEKFPNKFDYSQWNFISYRDKIKLICNDCGNIIETTPAVLLASKTKYGCKQCSRNARKYSNEEVILKLNNIYGEDRFEYSKFRYTNARQSSTLICKKCGCEFDVKVANLLRNRNIMEPCPICYKKSISKDQNSFINEIKAKFGDKFDYSKVEYKNAKTKIILICNDCGTEFETTPDNLLNCEIGCPVCAEKSRRDKRTHTTEEFIIKSKEVHGDIFDYSLVKYEGNRIPVTIICPKHGEFQQIPKDHLRGHGCPRCKSSRGELFVENYLKSINIPYINQYFIDLEDFSRGIFIDFKITINNITLFIEYNGIQHYKPIEFFGGEEHFTKYQLPRDKKVREYCSINNIPLLEIKYTLKDNEIKEAINNFLISNGIQI